MSKELQRVNCPCCGKPGVSVNADGTLRYHVTDNAACQDGPDSRKCKQAGKPVDLDPTRTRYQCRVCKAPVDALTANGRVRSHLTRDQVPVPCAGGSDFPLGHYPPTKGTFKDELEQAVGDPGTLADVFKDAVTVAGISFTRTGNDSPFPEPCNHRFEYGDDNHGHSGSVCVFCGEPEPDAEPELNWRTPADLLVRMPLPIQALAATEPDCSTCGHPVTPVVDHFYPDGRPARILWVCQHTASSCQSHNCNLATPYLAEPQPLHVMELQAGDEVEHNQVWFRVVSCTSGRIAAVVLDGPHAGQEGVLPYRDPEELIMTRRTSSTSELSSLNPSPDPAPGSRPPTPASVPAASPPSSPATSSGPTVQATGNASAPVPDPVADFLTGKTTDNSPDSAKHDNYGRYVLHHPQTKSEVHWTRSTTFAKSCSETYALNQWGLRMALLGATVRPDLVALAHGKDVSNDKDHLDNLTKQLKDAAGAKVGANLGTAVHGFTEGVDRAADRQAALGDVPPQHRVHVDAYRALLESVGLVAVRRLIEFSTGVLQYEVMGTADRVYLVTRRIVLQMPRGDVILEPGELVIGDLKTGKDLDYGWGEITVQLAVYAQGINTLGIYDWGTQKWSPALDDDDRPIKVRTDVAIVPHIPVDPRSKKSPALYGVDIESGWSAAVLCERVRAWRKLRKLAGPVAVLDAPDDAFVPQAPRVHEPTLRERAEAVTTKAEASAVYQAAVKAGGTEQQVNELVALMQARLKVMAEPGG